jgi:hypothetical protein
MMRILLLLACSFCCIEPITAGGKPKHDGEDIQYIELGSDQGVYEAVVIDGGTQVTVTKLSFGGDTTLDGIKKEHDSSSNRINLADIDSLTMLDPLYDSKRYPQQEFCKVRITTLNGAQEEVLMPRHLLICGEAHTSGFKKSWVLRTLSAITIQHNIL